MADPAQTRSTTPVHVGAGQVSLAQPSTWPTWLKWLVGFVAVGLGVGAYLMLSRKPGRKKKSAGREANEVKSKYRTKVWLKGDEVPVSAKRRRAVAKSIDHFAARLDDKRDERDLKMVAAYLRQGHIVKARDKAGSLDTVVRDHLPKSFFALLKSAHVTW